MIESFTDWLGQEVRVGDVILYCAQSGRSANMAMGTVVGIREKAEWGMCPLRSAEDYISSVRVQPISSARWNQWSPRAEYVDTRTGDKIKHPYADGVYGQPWAKRVENPTPKPVSLTVLGNITRWERPDGSA